MLVVAALLVIVAFLSWYGSWFGRPLSDSQIESYLNDQEKLRNVQHALSYIASRIIEGDREIKRWYPAVVGSAKHTAPEVRLTAAWVMGQDNTDSEFHRTLLTLVKDQHAGVRHNAALALVRFNDATGRAELVSMLESQSVRADAPGEVDLIVEDEAVAVAAGAPLVRIKLSDGQTREVRAPSDGRIELLAVSDGSQVEIGDQLVVLLPDPTQVENTLVALALVGMPDDIPNIERYARPVTGMPSYIQKQAVATVEAIRARNPK
jgi:acetyl/propionyl-CoA carboxylase alpha subunit